MSETQSIQQQTPRHKLRRNRGRRGAEMLEFTLAFLPLLAIVGVTFDVAWAIFAKSTLQRAVRLGVRKGVTMTAFQIAAGHCLTDTVKDVVKNNSMGILSSVPNQALIKVHYFVPPTPNSTGAAVDVSTQANANTPGNIMQVSVENYSLMPLMPRIFTTGHGTEVDTNPMNITVASADLIEPTPVPACVGTAP